MQRWTATELPSTWIQGIRDLTVEQVRNGVAKALLTGDGWPPSLPEFVSMANGLNVDPDESFNRMIKREPMLTLAEQVTFEEMAYTCRRENEKLAKKLWAKQLKINIKKENDGWLGKKKPKMIANAPVRNAIDDITDGYREEHKGETPEQMLANIKNKLKG